MGGECRVGDRGGDVKSSTKLINIGVIWLYWSFIKGRVVVLWRGVWRVGNGGRWNG